MQLKCTTPDAGPKGQNRGGHTTHAEVRDSMAAPVCHLRPLLQMGHTANSRERVLSTPTATSRGPRGQLGAARAPRAGHTHPVSDGDEGPGVQVPGGPAGKSRAREPHPPRGDQPGHWPSKPLVSVTAQRLCHTRGQGLAIRPPLGRGGPRWPERPQPCRPPGSSPGGAGEEPRTLTWGWVPAAWTCKRSVSPSSSWIFLKGRRCVWGQPLVRERSRGGEDAACPGPGHTQTARSVWSVPGRGSGASKRPAQAGGPERCRFSWKMARGSAPTAAQGETAPSRPAPAPTAAPPAPTRQAGAPKFP